MWSQAKFNFCFAIISPSLSFCYLSPFTILVVSSIYSNILIYFNIFVRVYSFFSIARRAIVKMVKQINFYYYCYYRYYYYCYYYYYCLRLPETAFPKRFTVLPLKITTNITDVESNILLVRSAQQRKWYVAEAVTTQTCNI